MNKTAILSMALSVGVAPTLWGMQEQYRGPTNEVVAAQRIRSYFSGQPSASQTAPRQVFDPEGFARWEFWWEHNRDEFLWPRNGAAQVQPETTPDGAGRYLGAWARRRERCVTGPDQAQIESQLIPALIRALKIEDDTVKRNAILALGKSGNAKVQGYIEPFLKYQNPEVQKATILALGMIQTSGSFYRLGRLYLDRTASEETRCWAATALGMQADARCGGLFIEFLDHEIPAFIAGRGLRDLTRSTIVALGLSKQAEAIPFLLSQLPQLRSYRIRGLPIEVGILEALGRLGDDSATLALLQALQDSRIPVRRAAALALTNVPSVLALSSIQKVLLNDNDVQTRNFAAIALARIGGEQARQVLLQALKARYSTSNTAFVALALGIQGERASSPELMALLSRSEARTIRAAAAVGLGLLSERSAIDDLRALMRDQSEHPDLRGYAALGLGLTGERVLLTDIESWIQDPATPLEARRSGLLAVGLLGDRSCFERLQRPLLAAEDGLGGSVAMAFGLIHDRALIRPLADVLLGQSPTDPKVRGLAAVSLGYLADPRPLPELARFASGIDYRDTDAVAAEILALL